MTSNERKDYNLGWAASERNSYDAVGRADARGVSRFWYTGFFDYASGYDKYSQDSVK